MIRKGRKKRKTTVATCARRQRRAVVVRRDPSFLHIRSYPIFLSLSLIYTLLHFGRPDFNDFKEEAVAVRSEKKKYERHARAYTRPHTATYIHTRTHAILARIYVHAHTLAFTRTHTHTLKE